ncbi:MAG: HAD-IA family hydrolase [Gammaproteobacteria bacterium]|nr:HAD-IA family hydrolase [Gammaproteobacteria bacterium]MBU1415164.1 HAD-IA family hydrolase [Gammaproteobacteria bacterium]
MLLKALIFDVDGTLADTERDGHRPAFNAAFDEAALGWHWDVNLYGKLLAVTGGKERIRVYAQQHDPDFLAQPDANEIIRSLHAAKTRYYLAMLEAGQIPLRPGVAELIAEAREANLRLAIATTTTPENVTTLLRASLAPDSVEWFEVIGAGDIVPKKKPAPDIYLWVLERLGLSPEACLAIEDSTNGLKSAMAARLPTLVTTSIYTANDDFTGALAVLPDLATTRLTDISLMHEINNS